MYIYIHIYTHCYIMALPHQPPTSSAVSLSTGVSALRDRKGSKADLDLRCDKNVNL